MYNEVNNEIGEINESSLPMNYKSEFCLGAFVTCVHTVGITRPALYTALSVNIDFHIRERVLSLISIQMEISC